MKRLAVLLLVLGCDPTPVPDPAEWCAKWDTAETKEEFWAWLSPQLVNHELTMKCIWERTK